MAGFDFTIACLERDRKVGVSTLIYFRKIANSFGIDTHYSYVTGSREFYVTADAYLPVLQSLLPVMVERLPAFASGYGALSGHTRARLFAQRLLKAYVEGMGRYIEQRQQMSALARAHGWVVQDATLFFDVGKATHLTKPAISLHHTFMQFEAGRVSPESMVEEAHTFVGAALRTALRARRGITFNMLVQRGFDKHIYPDHIFDALADLNRLRVQAKHFGQGVASRTDMVFWFNVLGGINMILDRVCGRTTAPEEDGPRERDQFMTEITEKMREVFRAAQEG